MRFGAARGRRVLTAVVVQALAATGTVATAATAGTGCGGVHNAGHGWSFIDLPQAPGFAGAAGQGSIPGRFTDFTTVAGEPNTLVVSDGGEIWRSGDAGCSWQPVYTVASDLPASWEMAPYVVTKFAAAAPGPHGGDRVYALLIPGFTVEFAMALGVAAPALVLLSPDGGKTWKLQQPASASWPSQPRCNAVIDVSVSPADQQVIDLLCVGGGAEQLANSELHGTPYQAYRSTDGGLSWAQVTYPSLFGGAQFTADPYSRNVAWTVGEVGRYLTVYRSGDGGATWQSHQMSKPDGDADWELSVAPTSGGRTAVVAASLPVAIYDSTDGSGMRWHLDGVDQHVKPLHVTGSFLPDGRDLLVTNLDFGCGRTLVLHRTTLRGRSVFVPLPSQAGQTWGSWHYTGGVHPSIVGRTQPCDGSALPSLLRYQP